MVPAAATLLFELRKAQLIEGCFNSLRPFMRTAGTRRSAVHNLRQAKACTDRFYCPKVQTKS